MPLASELNRSAHLRLRLQGRVPSAPPAYLASGRVYQVGGAASSLSAPNAVASPSKSATVTVSAE